LKRWKTSKNSNTFFFLSAPLSKEKKAMALKAHVNPTLSQKEKVFSEVVFTY
jgi:hypothetical protein